VLRCSCNVECAVSDAMKQMQRFAKLHVPKAACVPPKQRLYDTKVVWFNYRVVKGRCHEARAKLQFQRCRQGQCRNFYTCCKTG